MQKKGFTLVELLAVIVILALLATVAVPNVVSILNKEKQNTDEIAVTNLNDAAISYAKEQISLQKLHLNSCDSNANIYVYKYNNGKYDELRTFIPAKTCGNNKSNE